MNLALLIARLVFGLGMAAHGSQKLLGWFGGYGLRGTAGFFESIGFRPGLWFALAASLAEVGGGLLTAAGLLGPVGPALIVMTMIVAIFTVHLAHGFFAQNQGYELALNDLILAVVLAFAGPGALSLDRLLGLPGFSEATTGLVLVLAVALGFGNVVVRPFLKRGAQPSTASAQ